MYPIIVGLDPGQGGAMSISYEPGQMDCYPTPTNSEGECLDHFKVIKSTGRDVYIYMERVSGFIKGSPRGGHSMFILGRSYEYVFGVAGAFGIPIIRVEPAAWQRHFEVPEIFPFVPKKKWYGARKAAIYDIAKARCSYAVRLIAKTADAALICEYGRHLQT